MNIARLLFPYIAKNLQFGGGVKIIAEWSRKAKTDARSAKVTRLLFPYILKDMQFGGGVKIIAEWSRRAGRADRIA
ncbi:hypothetical protein [Nissabacter archeti]|uniref:Uncharacterized protein n=1 Tax=Nissabacter archeti TaxID=1917880 RepID=A0ABS5JJR4_9GAMM|nr:hypothetical protein [Nissabacter archeti]MBS0970220.1 hypothetical protein [Nissabacter archeti]